METNTLLFTFPYYQFLKNDFLSIGNVVQGNFEMSRFANDELKIKLQSEVNQRDCIVLGSISPPDTNLFSYLLLCHTLKKENARKISAFIPYLAYSRHDKNEKNKSYTAAFLGILFNSIKINELITVDIHSDEAKKLFSIPVTSLSTARIFANKILSEGLQQATIIAPDEGAIERCKETANEVNSNQKITYFVKKRTEDGVTHTSLHGEVSEKVIIIDDILDTGGTLISCCQHLAKHGVKEIYIMINHGLFTGTKWEELWNLGVKRIYCTNTLAISEKILLDNRINVLSIMPVLMSYLEKPKAHV